MNGAHLHLMLVHFPIAGVIGCALLLLAAWWLRNDTVKLVAFALVVAVGLSAWAADETGGMAARVIRSLPDVSKDAIHIHAEAAQWALYSLGLNGLLAAFGLFTYLLEKEAAPQMALRGGDPPGPSRLGRGNPGGLLGWSDPPPGNQAGFHGPRRNAFPARFPALSHKRSTPRTRRRSYWALRGNKAAPKVEYVALFPKIRLSANFS